MNFLLLPPFTFQQEEERADISDAISMNSNIPFGPEVF